MESNYQKFVRDMQDNDDDSDKDYREPVKRGSH